MGGSASAVIIALDRQEKGLGERSAIQDRHHSVWEKDRIFGPDQRVTGIDQCRIDGVIFDLEDESDIVAPNYGSVEEIDRPWLETELDHPLKLLSDESDAVPDPEVAPRWALP